MATAKEQNRLKRHRRIRKKISGSTERPRLSIHRSLKNLYLQVIDDISEKTLVSFSTAGKSFQKAAGKSTKIEQSRKVGQLFAEELKKKGIKRLAFDRGGYLYHGRVKAVAESLREAGVDV